jgi:hypothetical protein
MGARIEGRRIRGQEDKRGRSIEYGVSSIGGVIAKREG